MGRHKKMGAASSDGAHPNSSIQAFTPPAAPNRVRRLTERLLRTEDQKACFARLRNLSIQVPESPLRARAITIGALVCAIAGVSDPKLAQMLMRYLYAEAVVHQVVDEERALTRDRVDKYLYRDQTFSLRSQRMYRSVLYDAGRVLYPREFPAPKAVLGPRIKRKSAADSLVARDLYALASSLPESLRVRLVLILDLVTTVGLRAREIREIKGGDVDTRRIGQGHEIVAISVRYRGTVDRVVPIVDPRRGQRILDRAREVGSDQPLMPAGTREHTVEKNAVNRVTEQLKRLGYPGVDVAALRSRWILDLASTPGIPAAALLRLAGVGDLQVLVDQKELLPQYSPEELAELLINAEQTIEGAA
ncbi:hypothetical protein [Corynebacterium sp.]|uniref:hypothetical protein n=1 Tax=Corynebacterium sp. TaxID=1720 RepID=UPI0028B24009|nr:hypothetical protein [Corynebacterium sp.]